MCEKFDELFAWQKIFFFKVWSNIQSNFMRLAKNKNKQINFMHNWASNMTKSTKNLFPGFIKKKKK